MSTNQLESVLLAALAAVENVDSVMAETQRLFEGIAAGTTVITREQAAKTAANTATTRQSVSRCAAACRQVIGLLPHERMQ